MLPWILLACAPPDFEQEVAPILEQRCVGCHQDGGHSFSLQEPATLSAVSGAVDEQLQLGLMPPWPPQAPTPELLDSLALTHQEQRTLDAWLRAGAPVSGARLDAVAPPPLQGPSLTLQAAMDYTPQPGEDHRCFLVNWTLDAPQQSVGYTLTPEHPDVVHHVLMGLFDSWEQRALSALDNGDPGPGWDCPEAFMGPDALEHKGMPVTWFPGQPVVRSWPGAGMTLEADGLAVVQVHYAGDSQGQPAGVELELTLAEQPVAELHRIELGSGQVPIDRSGQPFTFVRRSFAGVQGQILSVRGHGHEHLRSLELRLEPAQGEPRPLLSIPRWDPDWQRRYLLAEPVPVGPDDVLHLECSYTFDPDAAYGEHEMCGGWVYWVDEPLR